MMHVDADTDQDNPHNFLLGLEFFCFFFLLIGTTSLGKVDNNSTHGMCAAQSTQHISKHSQGAK